MFGFKLHRSKPRPISAFEYFGYTGSGFIVRHGDRYFINNDRGELIIAKLSPQGYQEISRTALIKPTSNSGNRRIGGVSILTSLS
jgi:hypothetical protein